MCCTWPSRFYWHIVAALMGYLGYYVQLILGLYSLYFISACIIGLFQCFYGYRQANGKFLFSFIVVWGPDLT
jgi:hypothetical protein